MSKITAIIQARMNSNRLPGKVLFPVLGGRPLLELLVERIRHSVVDDIVIATTINEADIAILNAGLMCKYYRGSENDVLQIVVNAASAIELNDDDVIVEITGDCPLVDPRHIDILVNRLDNFDVSTNCFKRTWPDGCDISVYKFKVLKWLNSLKSILLNREHVIWNVFNLFNANINFMPIQFELYNWYAPLKYHWPELGLTLDEHDDYIFIKRIFEDWYFKYSPAFKIENIINYLRQSPDKITNRDVVRKIPGENK